MPRLGAMLRRTAAVVVTLIALVAVGGRSTLL
jgi:hypothetical protein